VGSSRDIVQYQKASGWSQKFPDNHKLPVCVRRNLQVWGSYPAVSIERNIVIARVCGLFGDWYVQDELGFVTPQAQDKARAFIITMFEHKWVTHLRIVEMAALVEVKMRIFPHACRKVDHESYERYVDYRVNVESDGFERKHLNHTGKFILHLINIIYFMLSKYNITLTLHLGDIASLPTWLGYNVLSPEHRGFLPADHELSHKLSILSSVAIPARRFAQDGAPNRIYYYNTKGKQVFIASKKTTDYTKIHHRGTPFSLHRLVALLWGAPNNTGLPMTADTFDFFEVDHIDGDRSNWDIDNLQWVIGTENRKLHQVMRKSKLH
jgi:hypothetical protein